MSEYNMNVFFLKSLLRMFTPHWLVCHIILQQVCQDYENWFKWLIVSRETFFREKVYLGNVWNCCGKNPQKYWGKLWNLEGEVCGIWK